MESGGIVKQLALKMLIQSGLFSVSIWQYYLTEDGRKDAQHCNWENFLQLLKSIKDQIFVAGSAS